MSSLEQCALSNALFIVPLALVVFLITRWFRNPFLAHALWLLVLIKLVTPPLVELPLPHLLTASHTLAQPGDSVASSRQQHFTRDSQPAHQPHRLASGEAAQQTPANRESSTRPTAKQSRTTWLPDLRALALLAWILGAFLVAVRAAWHIVTMNCVIALAAEADAETIQCASEVARSMGLRRMPKILRVDRPVAPALWAGNFRPVIILPATIFSKLDWSDRRAVIAHELAHFARRDHWVRWLELLVTTVYWWHPLIWLARSELRNAEELCCDATAIAHCQGATGRDYAATLLTLMDRFDDRHRMLASGMGSKHQLKKRLMLLADDRLPTALSGWCRAALVFVALLVLPMQFVAGQQDEASVRLQRDQLDQAQSQAAKTQPDTSAESIETSLLRPGDVVVIEVAGSLPEAPICGQFLIESEGSVALGPIYGRVKISGHSIEQAEALITQHLSKILQVPEVMLRHPLDGSLRVDVPDSPYRIETGDILQIRVAGALPEQPIDGLFRVEPSGKVALGPSYGRAQIAGLSLDEAERAIETKLAEILQVPEVSVTHGRWLHNPPPQQLRSNPVRDRDSREKVEAQQAYVRFLEQEFKRAQAKADGFDAALAGIELELARAELADMGGDPQKVLGAYRNAEQHAAAGLTLAQESYDAGLRTLTDVLMMAQKQQQIKRVLLGMKRSNEASSDE